jgi:hypothetical protein
MRKLIAVAFAIAGFANQASASPSSAACPRDGEQAQKTDEVQIFDNRCSHGAVEVTYSHLYYGKPPFIETHTFKKQFCN